MPRRLCRWGRVSPWFWLVRRRLWRGLWRGVILSRRHDDQRGRKILAEGGNWRAGGQRECCGKYNRAGPHGRVLRRRFAQGAAQSIDAPSGGGNPIWSRPNPFVYSRRPSRIRSAASKRKPRLDDFCASPENSRGLSYHIRSKKRNSRTRRERQGSEASVIIRDPGSQGASLTACFSQHTGA